MEVSEYWLAILFLTRHRILFPDIPEHLQQAFYPDRNSSPSQSEASTHHDMEVPSLAPQVPINEDDPELANNQENEPPLASRLIMPSPSPLQAPPASLQPLPTAAAPRCNRNQLKQLRRQRRQQRPKQLENPSGVHVQNRVYVNATAGSTVNNVHCLNSSPPAK